MGQDSDTFTRPPLRLGIFGGTFDPPHLGHTTVVTDVTNALELDQVLWIPANQPQDKSLRALAPVALRIEMTRAAVGTDLRFELSRIEAERGGASFTVETVRALRRIYPGAILFLIIGTDQFRRLNTWHSPEELLHLAKLVVMDRDGMRGRDYSPDMEGLDKVCFVGTRRIDISSTDVRAAVRDKRDLSALVHTGVAEIILREGLYRS
ncbi:MAG TPA: nicotinate (nicotinamide) nucleotide adenylyltransferase [Gemmatimonadetes bacterium]|nr:nicotinate (nicotinamide) nucleotide adenylyltransferase [Gemmatimonadota bacterium]|tara:strand:- start:4589 stop:5212 length:624 start_codon:yes stop_codon:yes gene_type:complete